MERVVNVHVVKQMWYGPRIINVILCELMCKEQIINNVLSWTHQHAQRLLLCVVDFLELHM